MATDTGGLLSSQCPDLALQSWQGPGKWDKNIMNRSNIDILQQPARDEEFFLPKIFPKLSRSKEQIILSLVKRDTNKMRRRGLYLAWRGPQNIDAKSLFLFVWMKRWGYKLQQMHPITASQGGEGLIMMILVTVLWKGEDDEYLEWSSSVNKQHIKSIVDSRVTKTAFDLL